MKFYQYLIALLAIPLLIFAAPKYPFPQSAHYSYGILPTKINNDQVQAAYADFYARLYEENGDKTMARIKWDTESMTVSEGIGYGMIIMAYMDNATNNTQAKFDKLWKYYNNFLDAKGLMNWKINGFTSANQMNAATDAELDVAVSLMEAYKQWGDEKYLTDAKTFIGKIWKYEVDSSGNLSPGDSWGIFSSQRNPSYFCTGALQLFKKADTSNWNRVITNSYALLLKVRNATTGLVPDWCTSAGQPREAVFKYDAIRTPWRMAWAYCWYGHDTAKTICTSIASWITTKTGGDPAKIGDGYNLDGSVTSSYNNSTFVGCLGSSGMVDAKHQAWLDAAYIRLQDTLVAVKETYFNQSLKLLNLLLMSGNMPNFWDMPVSIASPKPAGSSEKAFAFPSVSYDPRGDLLNVAAGPGAFSIGIYNSAGRVTEHFFGRSHGGRTSVSIDKRLQAGVYWARLNTASGNASARVIIAR
jgi:endoglucanase